MKVCFDSGRIFVEKKETVSSHAKPVGLHVIVGPMFGGKTLELIKRGSVLHAIGLKGMVVRPKGTGRESVEGSEIKIASRGHAEGMACVEVNDADEICACGDYDYYLIDEAQFLEGLFEFCSETVFRKGKLVVLAYLNGTFQQKPFLNGPLQNEDTLGKLMAMATHVKFLHAMCMDCKTNKASYSKRLNDDTETKVIGDKDLYKAVCVSCLIANP